MNEIGPPPLTSSLIDRIKAILLRPRSEWARIDTEPSTIGDIYRSHVLPLAAIGPVAGLIGGQVFGYGAFGIAYRPTLAAAVVSALVAYGLTLVFCYLLAVIIDLLAPQFGATPNRTQAFKVAAYGATASWLAGIFGLVPAIAFLGLLGLYSLYLIYLGLPIMMKAPADKAMSYTVVVMLVAIVAGLVIGALTAPITRLISPQPISTAGTAAGTLSLPGGGSVDVGKLEAAGKRIEEATKRAQAGEAEPAIPGETLQGLLPASLPGLARTSIEHSSASAAGFGGSTATARYGEGDNRIDIEITDLGAMGGLAALGGAMNIESSKQSGTRYERMGKVAGRMTSEEYDTSSKRGKYGTLVADRVMVSADGRAPSIDAFKSAVASVDLGQVERLARR